MSCSKSLKATDLHSSWKVEFDWKDFPEELVQPVLGTYQSLKLKAGQDGRKEVYEEFRMLLVDALFAVIKHKRDNEKIADSAEGDVTMFEVERTYDTFQEKIRKMMLEDNLMCSLFIKGKGQILRVSAALWLLFHAVDKPDKVSNSLDSGLSLPTVIPERVVSAAVAVVTYSIHQTGLLHGRRHNEDAGTVDNSTTDVPRKPASTTDVPHLESASTSRRTTNFGGQTLSGSILLVPGRVLSVKNLLTKRFFKTRGKKEVADTMLAMQDQHLGEVKTLSHRGGQRVYFVKHDILGLPDADKTAAIVALAQHGVNIKEYADTLVDRAKGTLAHTILQGKAEGARPRGRPRRSWISDLQEWTGHSANQMTRLAEDRQQWKAFTENYAAPTADKAMGESE
ncbi:Hypp8338 [Branchiostoma lanceolatum]|uniref:Hypp8338 protein n=1 Tax=Branchiostoma lanceolatum TaxID=7740 RepID=A0A8J9Z7M3_BRALA|nr:Hypp8338 [Branchiostoma lanceolatum]